jgi:hypothetical protein
MRDFLQDDMTMDEVLSGEPFLVGADCRICIKQHPMRSLGRLSLHLSVGSASATIGAEFYSGMGVQLYINSQIARSDEYMGAMLVLDWLSKQL